MGLDAGFVFVPKAELAPSPEREGLNRVRSTLCNDNSIENLQIVL
jgi:hypothetical protein